MNLRVITYLAPNMQPVYQAIVEHVARALGCQAEFMVGAADYADIGMADLTFICGLPYVLRSHFLEAIAAPVLVGKRYQNRPIYYSDVIVRHDSPFKTFADLRGHSWAYNEPESQSGYGITRYHLLQLGETKGFFSQVIEAGFHQKAMRLVGFGKVDGAAIDSGVLATELRDHPELRERLRVIEVLGPSTIQPIALARRLSRTLKGDLQAILNTLHQDQALRPLLDQGLIDRFVAVEDADYDDIRAMLNACEQAGFLELQ